MQTGVLANLPRRFQGYDKYELAGGSLEDGAHSRASTRRNRSNRKRIVFALIGILLLVVLLPNLPIWSSSVPEVEALVPPPVPNEQMPPLYPQLYQAEESLPQNNPDLPYPEGRNG